MPMQKGLISAVFLFSLFSLWPLYADTPAEEEARLLSNVRQLTFEGRRAGEGYFSADGGSMIFQSERDHANPFY
ncbi:MAG: hypothetical protein AB2712_18350, partial [Candidatus Thiodiazotropha sp.]